MSRIVTALPGPAGRLTVSAFKILSIYRIGAQIRNRCRIVRRDIICE